jgi:hypothetical protein
MRRGLHRNARIGEVPQYEAERYVALLLVDRHDAHLRAKAKTDPGDESSDDEKLPCHKGQF